MQELWLWVSDKVIPSNPNAPNVIIGGSFDLAITDLIDRGAHIDHFQLTCDDQIAYILTS